MCTWDKVNKMKDLGQLSCLHPQLLSGSRGTQTIQHVTVTMKWTKTGFDRPTLKTSSLYRGASLRWLGIYFLTVQVELSLDGVGMALFFLYIILICKSNAWLSAMFWPLSTNGASSERCITQRLHRNAFIEENLSERVFMCSRVMWHLYTVCFCLPHCAHPKCCYGLVPVFTCMLHQNVCASLNRTGVTIVSVSP